MLPWMVYVVIVTLALSAAALAAERALRLRRRATRWTWAIAIIASLIVPTVIASVSIQVPSLSGSQAPQKTIVLRNVTSLSLTALETLPVPPSSTAAGASLDARLESYWIIASSIMVILLAASAAQLFWRKRRWRQSVLGGVPVYVAPDVGPAVVGLLRPRIVVPPWVVDSPPARQAHVIAHEQAHLDAGDPRLLTGALCLLVFMPWNLPLWWHVHRLRRAIEVDCDARVLRAGHDVTRYGETLLEVGQRQSAFIGTVAAMSESTSFLEQRIRIMLSKPTGLWKLSAALFTGLSVCLLAVAAQVSPPNSSAPPAAAGPVPPREAVPMDPAQYDNFVGHYQLTPQLVMHVRREGDRLLTEVTGQRPAEIFPSGKTEFFLKVVNAQLSFDVDQQGRATALTLHQGGHDLAAPRVDDGTARAVEDNMNARIQSQTPKPGSEAAVRRMYNDLLAGKPDYSTMSPILADAVRKQFPQLSGGVQHLGAIQSIDFRGVGNMGWDVYDVHSEHGTSTWRLNLSEDGKVDGALFTAGP